MFTVRLSKDGQAVEIIDQTLLPNEVKFLRLESAESVYEAIYELRVRGAPAIGIAAAFGMYVLAGQIPDNDVFYAVKRMLSAAEGCGKEAALPRLYEECNAIYGEDRAMCRAIAENGLTLVRDGNGILTHCNAGALAASEYGTGLVYSDETRPLLQGARLTAFELFNAGIDVTLICDSAASMLMKEGRINACFVGCDRVAANGDVANKIGTRSVAVNAKYHGVPFYVFCPGSTIDFGCKNGADIVIEERLPEEITTKFFAKPTAPKGVKCFNPAFDVTDAELVTAIVTERGICRYPYTKSLAGMFGGN